MQCSTCLLHWSRLNATYRKDAPTSFNNEQTTQRCMIRVLNHDIYYKVSYITSNYDLLGLCTSMIIDAKAIISKSKHSLKQIAHLCNFGKRMSIFPVRVVHSSVPLMCYCA